METITTPAGRVDPATGEIIASAGIAWRELLDKNQRTEVAWATLYVAEYGHATTGRTQLMLIARLAALLDELAATGTLQRPAPPAAADLVLTFGTHHDKTLGEVFLTDSSYVRWLANNARDEEVRAAARALIDAGKPAQQALAQQAAGTEDIPF